MGAIRDDDASGPAVVCDGCGAAVDYPADVASAIRAAGGSVRCEECGPPDPARPTIRLDEAPPEAAADDDTDPGTGGGNGAS
jgi:hypothetical protein